VREDQEGVTRGYVTLWKKSGFMEEKEYRRKHCRCGMICSIERDRSGFISSATRPLYTNFILLHIYV